VCEDIDSIGHQQASILQMVYMRSNAKAVFVCFIDDGAIDFRRQLRILSPEIIHPHLNEIRLLGNLLRNLAAGLGWRLGTEHFCKAACGRRHPVLRAKSNTCRVHVSSRKRAAAGLLADLGEALSVRAHGEHGADPVFLVPQQLMTEILVGLVRC
jgi:hypothetical protein